MDMETQTRQRTNEVLWTTPRTNSNSLAARKARGLALVALACGLTAGCTVREFSDPLTGKVIYRSKRWGNMEKFDKIVVQAGTNKVEILGFTSDQVAMAERIAGAVAEAVVKGAKP